MNTKIKQGFPLHLLGASPAERITYFQKKKTDHVKMQSSYEQAAASLGCASGPKVVIVTGPTGVGKTTLARRLYKEVLESYMEEVRNDPGFVPIIGINAIPPNGANFNWKDFYIRLLEKHGDVLIDRKLLIPRQNEMFPELSAPSRLESSVTEALRRAAENCMRLRRTKVLLIDEAHHLLMVRDPNRLEFQFEALKSLTIETNVTIVLVGTYRLLDIRDQSGQLVRRSEIIHFPRYDFRFVNDKKAFKSVLATFLSHMPLEEPPNLLPDVAYFYLKTAGCVGILKDWLTRCLEQAIAKKLKTFDTNFAAALSLSNKSLRTIIEEAMAGELKLKDVNLSSIKSLLKAGVAQPKAEDPDKQIGSCKRVGTRKPIRDKTGGSHVHP